MNNDENEIVLYQGHLHGIIFLMPIVLLLLGTYIACYWGKLPLFPMVPVGLICILMGAILMFHRILLYVTSSLHITTHFITIQRGILLRQTLNVSIDKLESIDVVQTIFGSLLNYGRLWVRGTGGTKAFFMPLANPLTCRRFIETRVKGNIETPKI